MKAIEESTDKGTPTARKKWEPIMAEWRESGLSITEWVEQRADINYEQFTYARRTWFADDIETRPVEKPTAWSTLAVELPSGKLDLFIQDCRIEIAQGFDQVLLRELLEAIRHEA